jgi:serine/threonine protein kinase
METKPHSPKTNPMEAFGTSPNLTPAIQQTNYSGTVLKERYLIEGELGRGGIGVVYLARDIKLLQRRVVIKVLLESSDNSLHTPWIRKKFEQEVEALVRIDHPGVVGVLDVGEMPDGKPFFVMQYVEGASLRAVMEREKLGTARVAHIVRQIGVALTAAHEAGIVHRDLKPENVMVQQTAEGEDIIKLIDFGIATVKDSQATRGQTDAARTKVAGALPYMAPEQMRGEPVAASDTWSLGVMAYELLTGQLPFTGETMVQLHDQQRQGLDAALDRLPAAAAPVVSRVLSFEPEKRHARARDFGDALSEVLLSAVPRAARTADQGKAVTASAPTMIDAEGKFPDAPATTIAPDYVKADELTGVLPPSRQKPWLPGGIAAAALLALAAYWFWPEPATPPVTLVTNVATKPARTLSYSLSVRLRKNAGGAPVEMPGEVIFSPGDELRFKLISPQDGFLYVIGEAPQPDPKTGLPLYNLLYPNPSVANANLAANQMIYLPGETGAGFFVDKEQGAEKIWLVWSEKNLSELDALKRWYNDKDKGAINDAADTTRVRELLQSNLAARPTAEKDSKQITLKGGLPDLLIYPIELMHY